jgi:hypothetical protein
MVVSPRPRTGRSAAALLSWRPGSWKWPMTKARTYWRAPGLQYGRVVPAGPTGHHRGYRQQLCTGAGATAGGSPVQAACHDRLRLAACGLSARVIGAEGCPTSELALPQTSRMGHRNVHAGAAQRGDGARSPLARGPAHHRTDRGAQEGWPAVSLRAGLSGKRGYVSIARRQ